MKKAIIFTCFALALLSCNEENNECVYQPDISDQEINIEIERLGDKLLGVSSREELKQFLIDEPIITNFFLKPSEYPNQEVMIDELYKRFQNPHIDTLQAEIDRVFGDLSQLKEELNSAFSHIKYYYPDARIPKIKTVATGLAHDMYVSDSLIVIGLDFYLGEGAKYRPLGVFDYMLKRYAPEYIVPSIMLLQGISDDFNKTDLSDETILADIVAYGKSFYFAKHMMPCTPDSVIIWYSDEEIKGAMENQDIIWAHFIEKELLFETNHMVKKKYIEPRPKTYEIGEKAPGRIGTWLGWQIVKKYAEEEDASLPEVMNTKEPRVLFNKSKYRPAR
ncbi:gliding motility lipoprotein GldB [Fulvivirga sp. RKSG066]|uniref:gliding motility lipoprotein GldB n=1 Tax=Fulvivirga aurantia TaxID=2529383 RepID=UPI0012BBCEDF|nr:gliding motility lipoprotein GldB [Fulvivirga aurantia]MTI20063.1 gliding motility lipoprotein GldB [Fulvivirga aurantia]